MRNHLDTSIDGIQAMRAAGSKDNNMKPFKCPHSNCLKAFRNKSHLQSHLLTHKDLRIHACSGCKLTFSRKHDLNRHFRSVHAVNDGKPAFLCSVCGKGFGRMDSYRRHALRCCGYVG
ncbi:hypothetical protein BJ741DRAFT_595572 [Chytriomyces cf. hyalinus JEL632]|nr:hypothetical protein BJ741DRAFT_595572 [Chytriomyces cf. hyalinus JEL632]